MAFFQYLKDTRGELNHVAWPTRVQTIVFTVLVIMISVFVSLYLGFFDYLLTQGLGKLVERFPGTSAPQAQVVDVETEPVSSSTSEVDLDSVLPDAQ